MQESTISKSTRNKRDKSMKKDIKHQSRKMETLNISKMLVSEQVMCSTSIKTEELKHRKLSKVNPMLLLSNSERITTKMPMRQEREWPRKLKKEEFNKKNFLKKIDLQN